MGGETQIVTDGRHRYRVVQSWPPGATDLTLGNVSQLAVDRQDRVIVVRRAAPAVVVFAPDGTLETSWHHPRLTSVHGVCCGADDTVFIATFDAHQVLKFTMRGRLLMELGGFNAPSWGVPFNHPTDVAVAPDGEIFVSDGYGNARIHRFDPDGKLLQSWGEPGVKPGEFACPHGIWIAADGRVVTVDRDNDRLQVFDREGRFIEMWGGFCRPMDVWGNSDGDIFVVDQTPRFTALDRAGVVRGRARAFSIYPHGVSGDSLGNFFIANQLPSSITKFERMT